MKKLRKLSMGLLAITLAVSASLLGQLYINTFAANTLPGDNEVITIGGTTDGQPVNAAVSPKNYSGDGNIVLFKSSATNLPNAGGAGGLYVYNIKTDTTARVDISTNGATPNGNTFGVGGGNSDARISETGRYVTFGSMATNLIDGVTESPRYIYIRDTQNGITSKVGAGYGGSDSTKLDRNLAISNDGQFALISSRYRANSYPNNYGYALGENTNGTYSWISLGTDEYYENSGVGGLSCDGAFAVTKDSGIITLIDLRRGGAASLTAGGYQSASPIISCNGRYVLYATKNRTDITSTPAGMDTYLHLVRYDRTTGERMYIDSDSSNVFSTSHLSYNSTYYDVQPNIFGASIADTGDVVFKYNGHAYLKHLSDGSGTLEPIAKTASGAYINVANGEITKDGRYIFFREDPYNLGLAPSPSTLQIIRTKTGL